MSYANTALLLPCKTAGTVFSDFSLHNRTVQVYGTAAINSDQANKYANSFDHDGLAGTHLEVPGINLSTGTTATTKGARDCTIEFWLRPAADGTQLHISGYGSPASGDGSDPAMRQGLVIARLSADNKILISAGSLDRDGAAGFYRHKSTSTILSGAWTHVRVVISSNVVTLALNGTADTLINQDGSWQTDLSNVAVYIPKNWQIGSQNLHNNANAGGSSTTPISAAFFMDDYRLSYEALATGGFTSPGKLVGTLSNQGTGGESVKDNTGTAAVRTVIAVPRMYGAITDNRVYHAVSDASGNFSMDVPNSVEFSDIDNYSVIALDDSAGTDYNDLVLGRVPTV